MRNRIDFSWMVIYGMILIGVVGLLRTGSGWLAWVGVNQTGQVAEGEVTAMQDSSPALPIFFITYQFAARSDTGVDGETVTIHEQVSRRVYESLRLGSNVDVRYQAGDPSFAHIAGNSLVLVSSTVTAAAWLVTGLGAAYFYMRYQRALRIAMKRHDELREQIYDQIAQGVAAARAAQAEASSGPAAPGPDNHE